MKRLLLVLFLVVGAANIASAQGGKEKEGGLFKRLFKKEQKPRGQMKHFEKQKKDPNIKHNGTSYRRNKAKRSRYRVDGDGFGTPDQPRQKRKLFKKKR
jgi:hypothetical protein